MATTIKRQQLDLAGMISTADGNLLQAKTDGLYAALQAAPNLQNQYVSSSTGNDSNDGTRAAPLKTIYAAVNRLPDNTTGNIWLLEGDTFPMRVPNDPQTWGATVTNFGNTIVTGNRSLTIWPYGPQADSYAGKDVNSTNFYYWLIPGYNRPTLEFGHYVFNGRPVGNVFILGSNAGGICSLRGCIIKWTDAARAASTAANYPWAAGGYQWIIDSQNAILMGCILPAPILTSGGAILTNVLRLVGTLSLWNTSIPAGSTTWAILGSVSKLTFLDSGTMTDTNGATYSTVPLSTSTNASTRIGGITRDANGTPRNLLANAVL